MTHPASAYRNNRAYVFATAFKHGYLKAYNLIDMLLKKQELTPQGHAGLRAELSFFENNNSTYNLTPTLDCGDHTDFVGLYKSTAYRFDVTTNLAFKKLSDYEKFQREGKQYGLVLVDPATGKVADIIDINFPFCDECGGRIFNVALLMPERLDHNDEPVSLAFQQRLIQVCGQCHKYFGIKGESESLILDFGELEDTLKHSDTANAAQEIREHAIESTRWLKEVFNETIVACAGPEYVMTKCDGDGYWSTQIKWCDVYVSGLLPTEFDRDFSSEESLYDHDE